MSVFLGSHQNKLDNKKRVSIPAGFRTALRAADADAHLDPGTPFLVLRQSPKHPCIECWPPAAFQALGPSVDGLDLFSDDQEDLALSLYADAWPVDADKEGRVMLPEPLVAHAALADSVCFLGLGRHFQIWEPVAAERRRDEARARARAVSLPSRPAAASRIAGA